MTKNSTHWGLKALHAFMTLLFAIALVSLTSCIRAKEEKADLGPEVSPDEINLALSKSVQGATLANLRVGQFLSYGVTRRLESEETVINLGSTRVDVMNKSENTDSITYNLKITKVSRQSDGTFEVRESEEPLEIKKSTTLAALTEPQASSTATALAQKPIRVTYHRLRQSTNTIPAPAAVRARSDCGGLNPCELHIRTMQFDMVQWFSDDNYQKIAFDFTFSIDPPYLPFGTDFDQFTGLLITDCRATLVPVEGRTVYVRDCLNLEDFQK